MTVPKKIKGISFHKKEKNQLLPNNFQRKRQKIKTISMTQ
jgi:hypothetical protein